MTDTPSTAPLPLRLKRLREQLGMSVAAMADSLGVRKSTYSYYEGGYKKSFLPTETVEKLAEILIQRGQSPDAAFELLPQSSQRLKTMGMRVIRESIDATAFAQLIDPRDPGLDQARRVLSAVANVFDAGEFGLAARTARTFADQCDALEERRERLRQQSIDPDHRRQDR